MAKYFDMNSLRFFLYSVQDTDQVTQLNRFQDYDRDSINIFLNSVKDYADKDLYPYFREMDEDPARYEDGKIIVHPQIEHAMKKGGEMGLINAPLSYDDGGLQMPGMIYTAAYAILEAANNHVTGYWGLTHGAAELILSFANQELKDTYTPNMLEGKWGGTMCLTEPQAGSSLSDVITSATPQEDGSYKISGQKIFISAGDHEYVDNVVHLVLARIDGAPAGTKGISLFVVPKYRPTADGGLESNDVITAGDFQKLGQRGTCTVHLLFGSDENTKGWLVGEANKGLKYMFQMMNGARIAVGRGASAITLAAYYASLQYANERTQGRKISSTGKKNADEEPTSILNHADVRRMLLLQKAVGEGSLSLVLQAAYYHDMAHASDSEEEKAKNQLLLEMLTPIVKTYPAEMGREAVCNGVQVLGGYGFCSEYILQQYYRDIRIFSIYEGTTGIQSMDLLGRKLMMKGGKGAQLLMGEIQKAIEEASTYEQLRPYATVLGEKLQLTQKVVMHLSQFAMKGDFERFLSDATIFMEFFSKIVVGWQWLKIATSAKQALLSGSTEFEAEFYQSKVHTMGFYFKYEIPKTNGLAEIIMHEEVFTIPKEENVFV